MDKTDTRKQPSAELVDEWFKNAADALGYAKTGLPDTTFYTWVCFLCQQSAELYLKAFLMMSGVRVPKIHDLIELLKQASEIDQQLIELQGACETLADYYIEARYLPEVKAYSREQAEVAVRLASEVENSIRTLREEADSSARSKK